MEMEKRTVLIVEDEPILLKTNRLILQKSGFSVLVASDGQQAIEVAEASHEPIDLLLTDLRLPFMNGDVLAEKIALLHRHLKVVFLTGNCCDLELEALEHQVLRKPINMSELVDVVSSALA